MRHLILAVAAVALIGAPAYAAPKKAANIMTPAATNTTAPATPVKKTKKAKVSAMSAAAPTTTSAPAAKPAPMPMMAPKPAAAPAAAAAKGGGMKACAAAWDKFTPDQKAAYAAKAKGQKSKSGKALSGYNVYTGECMKK
jgi:hypothetical protein